VSAVERPARWLVAFAAVTADPGEEVVVELPIPARAFEHWDGGWTVEPGEFLLAAGPSSAVLPLSAPV
jgi:beta-glucosidase